MTTPIERRLIASAIGLAAAIICTATFLSTERQRIFGGTGILVFAILTAWQLHRLGRMGADRDPHL